MKDSLIRISNDIQKFLIQKSPEILLGFGISGMITSTVLAVRATPRALDAIDRHRRLEEGTTKKDILRLTWKYYVPSSVVAGVSIGCLIGANSISLKRNTALTTAYILSETAMKEYQSKVVETIGEKKDILIKDAVAKEKMDKNPVSNNEIIITSKGETLCYDSVSGRYFKSDVERIKKIEQELNKRLRTEIYISLNDFYYELGLKTIGVGENLGWHIDVEYLDIHFSSHLTDNDTPCLVLDYKVSPIV